MDESSAPDKVADVCGKWSWCVECAILPKMETPPKMESAGHRPPQECSRHQQGIQTVWDCLGIKYADCSRLMQLCYLLCNFVEALNAPSVRIIDSVDETLNLNPAYQTDAWPFCEMVMFF